MKTNDFDTLQMTRAEYRRLPADYKIRVNGVPYALVLDGKTQGTVLVRVDLMPPCELCGEPAGEGGAICPACAISR